MVVTNYILGQTLSTSLSELNTNITYLGVGDDATSPTINDTTLANEVDRNAEYSVYITTNELRSQVRFDTSDANGSTLREIGTFNASSSGTMYSRNLVTAFSKTSSKRVIYIVTFGVDVVQT
jgi:hypothetical protein